MMLSFSLLGVELPAYSQFNMQSLQPVAGYIEIAFSLAFASCQSSTMLHTLAGVQVLAEIQLPAAINSC